MPFGFDYSGLVHSRGKVRQLDGSLQKDSLEKKAKQRWLQKCKAAQNFEWCPDVTIRLGDPKAASKGGDQNGVASLVDSFRKCADDEKVDFFLNTFHPTWCALVQHPSNEAVGQILQDDADDLDEVAAELQKAGPLFQIFCH